MAERTGKQVTDVANVIIWGNHSSSQYPDVNHGTVAGTPIRKAVQDDAWLNGDFISVVQQRGAAIIKVWECLVFVASESMDQPFRSLCFIENCAEGPLTGRAVGQQHGDIPFEM